VIQYIIRRVIWAFVLLFAVTIVTYVIFFVIPVDPAKLAAGKNARPSDVARVKHYLGLDRPPYVQYGKFIGRLSPIDFGHFPSVPSFKTPSLGRSFANRQNVNSIVSSAAPVTASLVFGGVIFWMLLALPIGILSALRPRSLLDRGAMIFVLIGISAHPIWIGLILLYVFAFKLGWFPIGDYCNIINPPAGATCGGVLDWATHLILPWCTFMLLFAALYVRMIRANVMETLNDDFVRTARAKGAGESRVLVVHVLRNALLPVVTMLGMDIALALGGAVFTETVFGLNGLGRQLVYTLEDFDLPTTQGIVVFGTLAIIAFNLIVDLLYAWIDPRIRLA
jgi:peptide/nickel transport system permease protein